MNERVMQLKNHLKIVVAFLTFILSANLYADALLVLDMRNVPVLPKHFRTSSDNLPDKINTLGLADLRIAGGAQFSKLALSKIVQRLHTKHLTIIDLREESHGFLNGNAISWYEPRNDANAGMSQKQIERLQAQLLSSLDRQEEAKTAIILRKTPGGRVDKTKTVEFSVHGVSSEEEIAADANLNYERLYVQDYHAPTPKQVDRFIQIVKQLPANQWLYLHCRAGIGRTTTFMVMYDMMRNAKKVPLNAILFRQTALGGKDLTALPDAQTFKYHPAVERLDFLKQFYQYAKENHDNFATSFSSWVRRK